MAIQYTARLLECQDIGKGGKVFVVVCWHKANLLLVYTILRLKERLIQDWYIGYRLGNFSEANWGNIKFFQANE